MTDQQRQLALQTNKLQLSFWEKTSHFGIVGFLLLIPLTFLSFHLKDALNGTPVQLKTDEIPFLIVPPIIALLFYKLQVNRLKFKEIHTSLSREELYIIIEKTGKELKWYPQKINNDFIIAKTHPSFFSGSWGEQIIILFDTNRILVNSICDPDQKGSLVSMGRNKKNVTRLTEEILNASR